MSVIQLTEQDDDYSDGDLGNTIHALKGNDTVYAAGGDDVVHGGDDNDEIFAGPGRDYVYGGNQNDRLYAGSGIDFLYGEAGDDEIIIAESLVPKFSFQTHAYGGIGNDFIWSQDDTFSGNLGIYAYGDLGSDTFRLMGRNLVISGGPDEDNILANGESSLEVAGGWGADRIQTFGLGTAVVHGGPGNDLITHEAKAGRVYGEDGNDYVVVSSDSQEGNGIFGGDGDDTLLVERADNCLVRGDAGDDSITLLWHMLGDLDVEGGDGDDRIDTASGSDSMRVHGGNGDDVIQGPEIGVNVRLTGGRGTDLILGGGARETLVFGEGHVGKGDDRDVIRNFDATSRGTPGLPMDVIDLSPIDADPKQAGDQAFAWAGTTADPAPGALGWFQSGNDVIIAFKAGSVRHEIELDQFAGPIGQADFVL